VSKLKGLDTVIQLAFHLSMVIGNQLICLFLFFYLSRVQHEAVINLQADHFLGLFYPHDPSELTETRKGPTNKGF
jgi:hypothetical protein